VAQATKYVFVTGGVLSGLGKGITAASIGNVLKARGLKVNLQKCDPYLNVDAGLLNPREHGECFVTKDGAETDLDLGHYERFIDEELTQKSSLMSGRILLKVIEDERNGKYEGQTVQIIPHVTGAIQKGILEAGKGSDVHIVEIGGTVGDYESLSFIEAIRELALQVGRENCLFVHVVYVPYLGSSKEFKTKPAQSSVRELRGLGIQPDVLAARSENPAPESIKKKLSLFCGVAEEAIALLPNAPSIYQVPLTIEDEGVADVICRQLGIKAGKPKHAEWRKMVSRALDTTAPTVTVGVVAKYMDNLDTYMCVFEALKAAAWQNGVQADIRWIDAAKLEQQTDEQAAETLSSVDGILVPGGFGGRGAEGKIRAATYAMDRKVPYLGLCYGLHMLLIAAARRAGLAKANTTEIDEATADPVITTMSGQEGKQSTGGTMRLGDYDCVFEKGSLGEGVYKLKRVTERHRHRYEVNPKYRSKFEAWGLKASGVNPDNGLVEVMEGIDHPFMLASQYHPEFKSRPNRPHPMFDGFIRSLLRTQEK
jgi:CTP synthase